MPLLPDDEKYLQEQGYIYSVSEWNGQTVVVLKDYPLPPQYSEPKVNLLVMIPPGYPIANMDMFWIYPAVKLRSTNAYPVNADCMQLILDQTWQRFSRHYPWRPGVDCLHTHLGMVSSALRLSI